MNWYELQFKCKKGDEYSFKKHHLLVEADSPKEALEVYSNNTGSILHRGEIINVSLIHYVMDSVRVNNTIWYEFTISGGGGRPGHWGDGHRIISASNIQSAMDHYLASESNISNITQITAVNYMFPVEYRNGYTKPNTKK